jgi:hypothetical protein
LANLESKIEITQKVYSLALEGLIYARNQSQQIPAWQPQILYEILW